eukprot:g32159.t1
MYSKFGNDTNINSSRKLNYQEKVEMRQMKILRRIERSTFVKWREITGISDTMCTGCFTLTRSDMEVLLHLPHGLLPEVPLFSVHGDTLMWLAGGEV